MTITEDRVTIFTKNTGKYSGIALVLDLTRSINHTYGSSVAAHPIEGSGSTIADHQYLKNIKIQIAGHISNGVKIPNAPSDYDGFESARNYNSAVEEDLDRISEEATSDKDVLESVQPDTPITQEEADALNRSETYGEGTYEAGDTLDPLSYEDTINDSVSNVEGVLATVGSQKDAFIEDQSLERSAAESASSRRVYSNNQLNKQLDALILLENIRDHRLLVDVLTPNRLYTDMTMNFNLPRNMRQGTALEVNMMFEQQRFNEIDVESVPYSKDSSEIEDTEKQDEKAKEVKEDSVKEAVNKMLKGTILEGYGGETKWIDI